MSALRAPQPAAPPHPKPTRLVAITGGRGRQLAAIRAPLRAQSGTGFLALCGALLASALITVLLLNTSMIYRSYEMARLQVQVAHIEQDVQVKQEALRAAQVSLPHRAAELGMSAAENPQILDVTSKVALLTDDVIGATGTRQ